jgi:hypothetical protein
MIPDKSTVDVTLMIGANCADGAEPGSCRVVETSKIIEDVRVASLNAAKNLTPGNCALFNTVRAAWNAISVPAPAGEPTC